MMNAISAINDGGFAGQHQGDKVVVNEELAEHTPSSDPAEWVDRHGDYLFAYAMSRLRDASAAEDLVQETLLAALQAVNGYAGKSSERTWLTGILKHKIIDYYRRHSKQFAFEEVSADFSEFEGFFKRDDEWDGHWNDRFAPVEWQGNPAENLERAEFRGVLDGCLMKLPNREAYVFTLREVDGLTSKEICDALMITSSNFWVIIHRARMNLRRCIELNWFRKVIH